MLKIKKKAIGETEDCIRDINIGWLQKLSLKDKTEIIHFTSSFYYLQSMLVKKLLKLHYRGGILVLSLIVTSEGTNKLMTNLCRGSTFAPSRTEKLRRFLDQATSQKLIQAFVIGRLDRCHYLLYGLQQKDINKLKKKIRTSLSPS